MKLCKIKWWVNMACNRDTVSQRTVRAVRKHFIKMQWRHPMAIQCNFNIFVMYSIKVSVYNCRTVGTPSLRRQSIMRDPKNPCRTDGFSSDTSLNPIKTAEGHFPWDHWYLFTLIHVRHGDVCNSDNTVVSLHHWMILVAFDILFLFLLLYVRSLCLCGSVISANS